MNMSQSPNTKTKKAKHPYEKPQAVVLSIQSTESGTGSVIETMMAGGSPTRKAFGAMNAAS
jgi:hypothetical protein